MAGIDGELIERAQQCVAAAVLDAIPLRAHFGVAQLGSEQGETMPAGEFLPLEVIGVIEAVTPRAFAATVLADDDAAHGGNVGRKPQAITRAGVVIAFPGRRGSFEIASVQDDGKNAREEQGEQRMTGRESHHAIEPRAEQPGSPGGVNG